MAAIQNRVGGVILGELESSQRATEYAQKMKECPRLLFSAVKGRILCLVCVVSKKDLAWLKIPEKEPGRTGFRRAEVYVGENHPISFHVPSPRKSKRAAQAPCGADGRKCDLGAEYRCRGCPATGFYRG